MAKMTDMAVLTDPVKPLDNEHANESTLYKCTCGETFDDATEYHTHQLEMGIII